MAIRVGLIGAGGVARTHLKAYEGIPDAQVVALSDTDRRRCREVGSTSGTDKQFPDYKELLRDKSVDLVDICLPPYLHHPMAIDALREGKDVILEKPIALNLQEADELIETAHKEKRIFL